MSLVPVKPSKTKEDDLYKIATCEDFKNIYLDVNSEKYEKIIETANNDIMPVIDIKKLLCVRVLISGSSGSGKTYMAEKLLEQIKPDTVYLFSSINDSDYSKYNVKRIDLNHILSSFPKMTIHDIYDKIEDNIVAIFDDIVSFGTKLSKPYLELRLVMLQKGRHRKQSVFVVEQQATAGNLKGSQSVLLNCNYFITFPKNNFRAFTILAKNYLGFENKVIEYFRKNNSRYLFISKNHPSYYVASNECGMIDGI